MQKKALVLYNKLSKKPKDDEADVIEQVEMVTGALGSLGYQVSHLQLDLNLGKGIRTIRKIAPDLIFNLVETIGNKGEFTFLATSLLNHLRIPYSGSPLIPMFLCSNKFLAKKELQRLGIGTPAGFGLDELHLLQPGGRYILKPTWEEGSLELDEENVFAGSDQAFIRRIAAMSRQHYFVEEFIDGREFNISILGGNTGPEVLPLAEMTFLDYPEGKPRIMGYRSKWDDRSFEYSHTRRTFSRKAGDGALRQELERVCLKCWHELGLKGYVRVDFRVTPDLIPLVIDINLNPCLSESGGFMAASKKKGYTFTEVMARVLEDAFR